MYNVNTYDFLSINSNETNRNVSIKPFRNSRPFGLVWVDVFQPTNEGSGACDLLNSPNYVSNCNYDGAASVLAKVRARGKVLTVLKSQIDALTVNQFSDFGFDWTKGWGWSGLRVEVWYVSCILNLSFNPSEILTRQSFLEKMLRVSLGTVLTRTDTCSSLTGKT